MQIATAHGRRTRAALDAMTSGLAQKWLRSERELAPEIEAALK